MLHGRNSLVLTLVKHGTCMMFLAFTGKMLIFNSATTACYFIVKISVMFAWKYVVHSVCKNLLVVVCCHCDCVEIFKISNRTLNEIV